MTKKYEDYKKSYYKMKDERDKLKGEGNAGEVASKDPDVAQKYESLKSKYRVSLDVF
jgi:hypothetical protein